MLGTPRLIVIAGCSLAAAASSLVIAGQSNPSRTTSQLLVDLARDHGLMRRDGRKPADVRHITALLDAAIRIDPSAPDPYVWKYELAALRGDVPAAFEALGQLIRVDADNAGALEQWLATGSSRSQNIEGRRAWLREQVKIESNPPRLRALIRTRLARLDLHRLDRGSARIQLDRAVALDQNLPDIAFLRLELLPDDAPPRDRVRVALAALRVNPFQVELAWSVARFLAECGFVDQASSFHTFALDVNKAANPGLAPPPARALDLAHFEATRGALADAEFLTRQALEADPGLWQGQFFLHWLLTAQGSDTQAKALVTRLAAAFDQISDPKKRPVEDVAQAAWFYCTLKPTPARALQLAQAAAAVAPDDPFVARVLGWAQALNGRKQQASATLLPLAADDPDAVYQLARLMLQDGDTSGAKRVLDNLTHVPVTGPAHERLASLPIALPTPQPAERRYPQIANMLADFNMDLLSFHENSAAFLQVDVALENPAPAQSEPWWVRFSLKNIASFDITLGPDRMVNPIFLLSFNVQGVQERSFPHLFTISLDRKRILEPGESVSIRRTIDIGPLRRQSRRSPQQLLRVTMTALFDPQRDAAGRWSASLSGQQLAPVVFNRVPAATGPGGMQSHLSALVGPSKLARFGAIETLAALLGERQRADLHLLSYRSDPVPAKRIRQTLVKTLSTGDWETRVRVLDAMQAVGFDQKMLDAVRAQLRHPHWLVRMMAVRLLGERQGKPFLVMARRIAEQDDHQLVRELAGSYVDRWAPDSAPGEAVPSP